MKPRPPKDENGEAQTDSDGMSSFDSEASRINFWKDINTKDENYQGAIFFTNQNTL